MPARLRVVVLLLLYGLICLLPGFLTLPPLDRDESRFAQATKQMMQTGDPVEIRFQETARNKKPVGIYWMQAAAASVFGGADAPIWAYRIPSVIGALLAIIFTFMAGRPLMGSRAAMIGAVLFGISVLMVSEGHIAKTDAMMCAAITAMQAGLARAFMRQKNEPGMPGRLSDALLIGFGLGVSALIKGPVGLMVGGLTVAGVWLMGSGFSWVKRTRPLIWLPLALLIVLPWAIAITVETGWTFWRDAIMGDMLSKVAGGQEKHGAFPGYYLLLVMLTLFPGSILLFPSARRIVELRREPMAMFLIAWVVPSWLVFELLPTKLPHYVLPMYPALALAIGYYVAERMSGFGEAAPRWARLVNIVWWALMVLAVAGIMLAAPYLYGDGIGFMDVILACAVLAAAGIFATITFSQTWRLFVPAAAVLAAITYAGLFEVTFARVPALHVSPRLAEAAKADGWSPGQEIAATGYHEPSLVFLTATDIQLLPDGAAAAQFLSDHSDGLALVEENDRASFEAATDALDLGVEAQGTVAGFNYSRGRKVALTLFRVIK